PDATYLTLSHRWSQGPVCKLVMDNLPDFRKDIPIRDLSITFQDAIEATNSLGFEYIWIDSLCIIQDSTHDWAAEVTQMAQIYENAACNLSATA
ncbi:hypothetical protein BU23DRAFT_421303, partial [Bimuria novae-zelandiae CBS 107.79]